jgi:FAD/FMN-containing dehydrogenase
VDVLIPNKNFPEFWKWYEKDFDFFPLWIVPYKMPRGAYPWINSKHVAKTGEDFYIDAAVYGKKNTILEIDYSQLIENETFKLGGIKTLISKNNYTPERFAEIYNLELYNRVKQKTDPDNLFGTVYEKLVK